MGNATLEVAVETTGVRDGGQSGASGGTTDGAEDWRGDETGDRGVDGTGEVWVMEEKESVDIEAGGRIWGLVSGVGIGVVTEGDGVTTGSDETEAGNGMCAPSRSSISEIAATESAPTLNSSTSGSSASEGMLSKSLGYISAVMYDERSEIGFSVVAYSVSGSDGGMVGNEWYDEMDEGALGVTYPSLPDVALT
jgi:hypothetical protein